MEFGELIDYPMVSLYGKYEIGTFDWYRWHFYAQSVEDGSYYYFCHTEDNLLSETDIQQIDLNTWDFYECNK